MSDTRPVAIRCAHWLEVEPCEMDLLAAAELRRLHAEVEALTGINRKYLRILQQDNKELREQNEGLREAARPALEHLDRLVTHASSDGVDMKSARHAANVLREALGEQDE